MRIVKDGVLTPLYVRAVGEHTEINKTTETQSSHKKAMPFYVKKRRKIRHKLIQKASQHEKIKYSFIHRIDIFHSL